jgi:hypothetical protein
MKTLVLALLLSLPATVVAQAPAAAQQAAPDSLQILVDQQRALRADLDDGGIAGLTPRQNNIVRKAQDEFFALTQGKARLDDLSMDDKVRVENSLERINAEVKNTRTASDDQNVCWRERVSGSNLKTTRCGTKAEMREAREGARDFLDRPKVCGEQCGGGGS